MIFYYSSVLQFKKNPGASWELVFLDLYLVRGTLWFYLMVFLPFVVFSGQHRLHQTTGKRRFIHDSVGQKTL